MAAVSFTTYATLGDPSGNKVLIGAVTMSSSYAAGGDNLAIPSALNSIVMGYPMTVFNGLVAAYSNATSGLKLMWAQNYAGTSNVVLAEMTTATNCVNYTVPMILVGKPQY